MIFLYFNRMKEIRIIFYLNSKLETIIASNTTTRNLEEINAYFVLVFIKPWLNSIIIILFLTF